MSSGGVTKNSSEVIIVTGSEGHLGEALIRVMRSRGIPVVGIDILRPVASTPPRQTEDGESQRPLTDFRGSITDRPFLESVFAELTQRRSLSIRGIINTAVLHKPHIESHSMSEFLSVNVQGTLNLLEVFAEYCASKSNEEDETVASASRRRFFIQTSTTSTYGGALTADGVATFIDETVAPTPKNIYGVTKVAAENVCQLFARQRKIPNVFVLQTARFFPEEDDDPERQSLFASNAHRQFIELLHRRAEIEDLVEAHLLATQEDVIRSIFASSPDAAKSNTNNNRSKEGNFRRYICCAPSPFAGWKNEPAKLKRLIEAKTSEDFVQILRENASDDDELLRSRLPMDLWIKFQSVCPEWAVVPPGSVDRVYCSEKAQKELGWRPRYSARSVIETIITLKDDKEEKKEGGSSFDPASYDWRSDLAKSIGTKMYHRASAV